MRMQFWTQCAGNLNSPDDFSGVRVVEGDGEYLDFTRVAVAADEFARLTLALQPNGREIVTHAMTGCPWPCVATAVRFEEVAK